MLKICPRNGPGIVLTPNGDGPIKMAKAFLKYLLLLCILLSVGFAQLSAHICREHNGYSPIKIQQWQQASPFQRDDLAFIQSPGFGFEKQLNVLLAENKKSEEEDDESVSLKKRLERCSAITLLQEAQRLGSFFNGSRRKVHYKHDISSYRYLLLQVFRI